MISYKKIIVFLPALLIAFAMAAQPKYGQQAAEISLPSVNGDTIHLSALKGKVVLLDFWASWCGPCRVANRELVKVYSKFKSKGLEILSVSIDEDKAKWKTAIKKDKITWLQVIDDGGGWDTRTAQNWGIMGLPTSYLIDKNGTLVAMDLRGKDLEKAIKEMLDK